MKKFLDFDWLRAVQFLRNTVPKKEIQSAKKEIQCNDSCIFIACVCFSDFSVCFNYVVELK